MRLIFKNFTQIVIDKFVVRKGEKSEEESKKKSNNKDEIFIPEIEKVGEKFKKLRLEKHSSHETFAYDNEINRVQYWRIEKGSNITLSTFFRLLKIHNITPEEFFKDF